MTATGVFGFKTHSRVSRECFVRIVSPCSLGLERELKPTEYVLYRYDKPLYMKTTGNDDSATHLHLGDHSLNMVEFSARGRSNFQALRFRADKKKARAVSARALHDAVKASGYG